MSRTMSNRILPQAGLDIPGGSKENFTMPRSQIGSCQFGAMTAALQLGLDVKDEYENNSTTRPSIEEAETAGNKVNHKALSLEKMKMKMKRFRLTHNQTRFLMSEFTCNPNPDARRREHLSREIPGLTPRQVQVWFQNRRAKLKHFTAIDREIVLRSRALPDDLHTTEFPHTPFEVKSTGHNAIASLRNFWAANAYSKAPRLMRNDYLPRPNKDEYIVSPLSPSSVIETYMSSVAQGHNDCFPQSSIMFSRPAASASMSDMQRASWNDNSIIQSSVLSDAYFQLSSFHTGIQVHSRFGPPSIQHEVPSLRQPMDDYSFQHPIEMVKTHDQHQWCGGYVSPRL